MMLPWKVGIEPAIIKCGIKLSFETVFDLGWLLMERFVFEMNWKFQFSCSHVSIPNVLSASHYIWRTFWQPDRNSLLDNEPELDFLIFLTSDKMEWLWKYWAVSSECCSQHCSSVEALDCCAFCQTGTLNLKQGFSFHISAAFSWHHYPYSLYSICIQLCKASLKLGHQFLWMQFLKSKSKRALLQNVLLRVSERATKVP